MKSLNAYITIVRNGYSHIDCKSKTKFGNSTGSDQTSYSFRAQSTMAHATVSIWKPFCPVPHTFRDQLWLSVGGALGAWLGFQLAKWFYRQKLVKLPNPQAGQPPVLDILTGM